MYHSRVDCCGLEEDSIGFEPLSRWRVGRKPWREHWDVAVRVGGRCQLRTPIRVIAFWRRPVSWARQTAYSRTVSSVRSLLPNLLLGKQEIHLFVEICGRGLVVAAFLLLWG